MSDGPRLSRQVIVLGLFRSSTLFVAVVIAAAGLPETTKAPTILVIFTVDVVSYVAMRAVDAANAVQYRELWANTLTDRIFWKLSSEQRDLDVDQMFMEATKLASEDIKRADRDAGMLTELSGIPSFGRGLFSYLGHALSYVLFYGSAVLIGHVLRGP